MTEGKPTILIAEDHLPIVGLFENWLPDDYEVITATDGDEAISSLSADIDVALLDRRMPGPSGDEVLAEIRARSLDCRVALVTAVEPGFDILDMGFDDYLLKPIDRDEFLATVARLLQRKEYDEKILSYQRLTIKKELLSSNMPEHLLQQNDQYQALERDLTALRDELDTVASEFDQADFEAAFRQL